MSSTADEGVIDLNERTEPLSLSEISLRLKGRSPAATRRSGTSRRRRR